MNALRYVVITPARDEQQYLPYTIECMECQTVLPQQWIIVDDGSRDATWQLISHAVRKHAWITGIRRRDRGFRHAGTGVVEAFYEGYRAIKDDNWHFLVKFDADLSFEPQYFEACFSEFSKNRKLGIGGGTICRKVDGVLEAESRIDPSFHVRGATKIYRRECWFQIGGLIHAPGWDSADEIKANMLGWETATFVNLKLYHHRIAGGAYGQWSNYVKGGRANYIAGYHPLFMLAKVLRRMFVKPYGIGAAGLLAGYVDGYLRGVPRIPDKDLVRYLRKEQLNRLLGRPSLWSKAG